MTWEYKTIAIDLEGIFARKINQEETDRMLNSLGAKGWELISTDSIISNGYTQRFWAIFKRPLEQR